LLEPCKYGGVARTNFMDWSVFCIIVVGAVAVLFVLTRASGQQSNNAAQLSQDLLRSFSQNNPTDLVMSNSFGLIGVTDNGANLFVAYPAPSPSKTTSTYSSLFREPIIATKFCPATILDVELLVDSRVISHTQQSGAVGRTLLGGALLGTVGAIAGSSGSRRSTTTYQSTVEKIELRFLINNVANPHILVRFTTMHEADEWLARVQVLIHRAKQSTPNQKEVTSDAPLPSAPPVRAQVGDDLWRCRCGRINIVGTDFCQFCKRSRAAII